MKILAFEPFDAGSHRAVRESISRHSRHEWHWITRPGRAWKWRMRTAAIEMLDEAMAGGLLDQSWDVVFATSLMSLSDLRAVAPPSLRNLPFVLYMHENQAAYPTHGREELSSSHRDVHFSLTNLTSLRAADLVIWNSRWNHDSYVEAMREILAEAPEGVTRQLWETVRSDDPCIIWPPVEVPPAATPERLRKAGDPIRVVWPHRWEHDKGPDELLAIMRAHWSLPMTWSIIGAQFREAPPEFDIIRHEFNDRLRAFGPVERERYHEILAESDWVLSTARHEFFGISVVEAMLAGCLPWLPDRLSYPELLPPEVRGISPLRPPADPEAVLVTLASHLRSARAPSAVARLDGILEDLGTMAL